MHQVTLTKGRYSNTFTVSSEAERKEAWKAICDPIQNAGRSWKTAKGATITLISEDERGEMWESGGKRKFFKNDADGYVENVRVWRWADAMKK